MAEPSVLLVDEDSRRRRALEVGLRRAGFRVTVAGSAEQALWFLDHALPEVIVSASRFTQGTSSLSLAEMIRAREEWSSIVLIMLRDEGGSRDALDLADDVVGERVTIASLVGRTREALLQRRVDRLEGASSGLQRLRGSLAEITAIDLLRLIERLGSSGTLGVETPSGPATLWFSDGRVIDGAFGRFEGEDAVFRLLMVDEGTFELSLAASLHAEVIETPMENLIGDCLRQLDEWMRLCCEVPPLESCLRVDEVCLESRRDELAEELFALIRSCDGRRTIREVVESSDLGPLLALEAIQNLRGVGILVEGSTGGENEEAGDPSTGLGLKELPPLPAFPQPFPGLGAELGFEHDTPLVSGIPEEISQEISEERGPGSGPGPEAGPAGGKLRSLPGRKVANEYVFRPPQGGADVAGARGPSASAIERAIDDAISGLEPQGGASAEPGLPVRGAANGRSAARSPEGPAAGDRQAEAGSGEEEPAGGSTQEQTTEQERSPPRRRGAGRLGRVVSLDRIRESPVDRAPRSAPDRASSFTLVAGTAAGELVVAQAEPSLVECEEAMAQALRTPSVLINIDVVGDDEASGAEEASEGPPDAPGAGAEELLVEDPEGTRADAGESRGARDTVPEVAEAGSVVSSESAEVASAEIAEVSETASASEIAVSVSEEPEAKLAAPPRQREVVTGAIEDPDEGPGSAPDTEESPRGGAPAADDEADGASISSAKRSLPATPVGVVAGEIVEPVGAAASHAALIPESSGDLERLGALARQPPSTSAAMWSLPPAGRSSVLLSPSVSGSAISMSPAQSGAERPGAGPERSMAARSSAARSMAGVSAAHLFGADAAAISRLEPAAAYVDDDPVEFRSSTSGWWWVFFVGAASLGLWAWLHYGGRAGAEEGVPNGVGSADSSSGASEGPLSADADASSSSTGDSDGGDSDSEDPPAANRLTAEESAALEEQLLEGERLYQKGAEKEASMLVAEVLARTPRNPAALLLRAKISLDRGELGPALSAAKQAAKYSPELAEAYLTIGVVHEEQAEIADAIAAYERYLELAPDARYASGIRRQVASLRRKTP